MAIGAISPKVIDIRNSFNILFYSLGGNVVLSLATAAATNLSILNKHNDEPPARPKSFGRGASSYYNLFAPSLFRPFANPYLLHTPYTYYIPATATVSQSHCHPVFSSASVLALFLYSFVSTKVWPCIFDPAIL